jgi:hypothetical protein
VRIYLFRPKFDSGGDDHPLLDVLVLDEGVAFREVVLDDEVLFGGEGKVNRLRPLEVGGLDRPRLRLPVQAVHPK